VSAGATHPSLVASSDLALLAPKFREAVERAIADANARGFDAIVYEAYRSPELQAAYYARGRTVVPPEDTVTNAPTNLFSWHGYGLAVDVVSRDHGWDRPRAWFEGVAESFKREGCKWGGDWTKPDLPHFQWGPCRPSPSDLARQLVASGGTEAVWRVVNAV
jgi:peptidoglycan L-alanyl-D-glutamate endopeptidase CwlK